MIDAIRAEVEPDRRIAYALVFGSTARGTDHALSDVDVAIGLVKDATLSALEVTDLMSRLETAVPGRRVDLVIIDEAPSPVAYRAFRDGRVVFERDRSRRVEQQARAVLEYLDFKPVEDMCARGVLAAGSRGR